MAKANHTLSGIYRITNSINGKVYIGSSVDIPRRWNRHKNQLRNGCHHSKALQRAWNKYGEENFIFEMIEAIGDFSILVDVENMYIAKYKSADGRNGYNMCPSAGSTIGIKFGPHSEDHKRKISASNKGKTNSPETRAKLSKALKGRKMDAAWIDKIRKANTGRKMAPLTPEHKAIVSATHKGKIISDEHKARLSAAHKGRKLAPEDKEKKRASVKAFWDGMSPEQRAAYSRKRAETQRSKKLFKGQLSLFPTSRE